jgi:hypothetical protein
MIEFAREATLVKRKGDHLNSVSGPLVKSLQSSFVEAPLKHRNKSWHLATRTFKATEVMKHNHFPVLFLPFPFASDEVLWPFDAEVCVFDDIGGTSSARFVDRKGPKKR